MSWVLTLAALLLAVTTSAAVASADEANGELRSTDIATATLANALGDAEARPTGLAADGAPTLAAYLASGELQLNANVPLSGFDEEIEPLVGSFTVDGMTYAVVGEGEMALVAVAPATLGGNLADGSADGSSDDPSGVEGRRGIGSGWTTSPQPQPAPSAEADGSEGPVGASLARIAGSAAASLLATGPAAEGAEALVAGGPEPDADGASPEALALPEAVEHGGAPYALVAVGPRALSGCDAAAVVLPPSVASVDEAAFSGSSVAEVEVADGSSYLSSFDGMLFSADRTSLLLIPEGKQGAARIPKEAEVVEPSSFSHSAGVEAIDVEAGSAAFTSRNGCLYDVSGETLLRVPAGATDISIADGCTTVATGSLEGCANLEHILAPSGIREVSPLVFSYGPVAMRAPSLADLTGENSLERTDAPIQRYSEEPLTSLRGVVGEPAETTVTVEVRSDSEMAIWTDRGFNVELSAATTHLDAVDSSSPPSNQTRRFTNAHIHLTAKPNNVTGSEAEQTFLWGTWSGSIEFLGCSTDTKLTDNTLVKVTLDSFTRKSNVVNGTELNDPSLIVKRLGYDSYDDFGGVAGSYTRSMIVRSVLVGAKGASFLIYGSQLPDHGATLLSTGSLTNVEGSLESFGRTVYTHHAFVVSRTDQEVTTWDGQALAPVLTNYGSYYITTPPAPQKRGYKFLGWSKGPGMPYVKYGDDAKSFSKNGETFYAQWDKAVVTVTTGNNGSADNVYTKTLYLKYNDGLYADAACSTALSALTIPKRDEYFFAGYFDRYDEEGNGKGTLLVDSEGRITKNFTNTFYSGNSTIYARWIKAYKVVLDWGDAGTFGEATTVWSVPGTGVFSAESMGEKDKIDEVEERKADGWEFGGFYDVKAGEGRQFVKADRTLSTIMTDGEALAEVPEQDGARTLYARWTPVLNVDVPLEVRFDLVVDVETGEVEVTAAEGASEHAAARFASRTPVGVRVASVGQQAGTAGGHRHAALAVFGRGDPAKAGNLAKVRLALSADADGAPAASASLAELYGDRESGAAGAEEAASPLDLSGLGLVVPAGSAEAPGELAVRFALDCSGVPWQDVALGEEAPLLRLVYTVEVAEG